MTKYRRNRYKSNRQTNQSASPPHGCPSNSTTRGPGIVVSNKFSNLTVEELTNLVIQLSEQKLTGTKKNLAGRKYNGTAEFLTADNAEYLYLTNSYVARGVDTESEAVIRNGWSVKANNAADQDAIDLMLKVNNFVTLIKDINRFTNLYKQPMAEMYSDRKSMTTRIELLPPTEMDFQRDTAQNILFDPYGEPLGFVQKRNGQEVATWTGKDAQRIIVFRDRTLGGYYEGIPGIQTLLYPAVEYGNIRSSIADSFVRSLPVSHFTATDASEDQLSMISDMVSDKFTARTVYVTDERLAIKNIGVSNDIDVFKFIEPTLSEIAACFHMPIELLGATQYLRGDDFLDRYGEWIEHIKMKQKMLASIFERKVFNVIFPDGVTIKFNSPVSIKTSELITNVSYGVQSNAITSEQAFDILNRNQVFGSYSDDVNISTKSIKSNNKTSSEIDNTTNDVESGDNTVK
jgi:hypothetical protein